MTIFAVSIFILSLIGNSLVVYIVGTVKHMRSSTNMLIANMAFADLLMTIDIPYITKFVFVFNQWFGTFMGNVLCKFFHSAQVGSLAASVFSLVAISLDRSFSILFPMKTIMTQNVLRFTIAVVWLCALALTVPLTMASTIRYAEGRDSFLCTVAWGAMSFQAYIILLLVTGYAIPLLIIALFYSLAGLRLCSRKLPGHSNLAAAKKVRSASRSATVLLITVLVVFSLSWMPFHMLEMIRTYNESLLKKIPFEVRLVFPWFGYANSAINPIIYVIFSEKYRQEFYRILCSGPSRKDRYRNAVIGVAGAHMGPPKSRAGKVQINTPQNESSQPAELSLNSFVPTVPSTLESSKISLAANSMTTLDSDGGSLAVNTPHTLDPNKSRVSCESLFAVDNPLAHQSSEGSSVAKISLPIESSANSLSVDIVSREAFAMSLALTLPLTKDESCSSALATNVPPPCLCYESLPSTDMTSAQPCGRCKATDTCIEDICINMHDRQDTRL